MPRLFAALALVCATLVAAPQPAREPVAQSSDPGGRRLRVVTFNMHFGSDVHDRYDLQRTIDTLAALRADVIGVQEIVRNHAEYRCDDQPAQVAAGLYRATRQHWSYAYVNEWVTERRQCLESGRGDGVETEGLAMFAAAPSLDVDYVRLWRTRLALRVRLPQAPQLSIVVTHLASSSANAPDRRRQVEVLAPWVEQQGPLRILMGDFNAEPAAPEIQPVFVSQRDAWRQASERGQAVGPAGGWTRPHKSSRIDYITYTPSPDLRLESIEVVDTRELLRPWDASDHRPVVATFRLPGEVSRMAQDRNAKADPVERIPPGNR